MKRIITYILFVILLSVFIFLAWYKLGAFFCNQGNYYYERREYKKAAASYENSIRVNAMEWTAHLGLANVHLENKEYQASIGEYKKVLNINPFCARAYESLSHIYYLQGNYEEELQILGQWKEKDPVDEKIKQLLESCCYSYFGDALNKSIDLFLARDTRKAISVLENVLAPCSSNALAYYTLGYYYFSSQDYTNAEINLNKALEIEPQFYYAYKILSEIYIKRKNMEKAVFFAKKAVDLNSNDASSYHNLGILLMLLERYSEALPYFKKASSLDSNNANYAYSLASIYRDNKMYIQAIQEYERLSGLKNDYPNMHNDLAEIYTVLNKPDQALLEYQKETWNCQVKIKYSSNDPFLLNDYAYALNGIGQSEKAREIAEKLVVSYPQYRQAHITLSRIYQKMGKHDLAIKSLQKAKGLFLEADFIDDEISRVKNNSAADKLRFKASDTLYLKNGRSIKGRVRKEDAEKVILEVQIGVTSGELIFYRNAIERIEKEGRKTDEIFHIKTENQ